jgi:hypothetical protein
MNDLIAKSLENSYTYTEYRNHISTLLIDGLSTGNTQSEALTHYTTLNEVRMNRLDKTIKIPAEINESLGKLNRDFILVVLSEGWCGDAAQILPVINKMTEAAPNLDLQIVLRDENEQLMNEFLTNGSKSIPKLILVDAETMVVRGSWGPRPHGAAQLIKEFKDKFGVINEEAKTELQKWYLHDKGLSTMEEIVLLLQNAEGIK